MSQVGTTNLRTIADSINSGAEESIQFEFAKLQLALSQGAKSSAMDYIDQIRGSQAEQKITAAALNTARNFPETVGGATGNFYDSEQCSYLLANKLVMTGKRELIIASLQGHLDQLGSNTQQLMVFVQDFMGQYNSYLQGSNSAIQQGNQTLAELARVR